MKKKLKKLSLNRETVMNLSDRNLENAAGGGISEDCSVLDCSRPRSICLSCRGC